MIDFLCIKIPIKNECLYGVTDDGAFIKQDVLESLKLKRTHQYDQDGCLTNVSIPWDSVPSSFSSIAYKLHLPRVKGFPVLEIKASPAKVMQGHNVFGSDNFNDCAFSLINEFLKAYPDYMFICNWNMAHLAYIDLTFHCHASSQREAVDFIEAIKFISNRQVKSATEGNKGLTTYQGTAYWNPRSDRRILKCYSKKLEIEYQRSRLRTDDERAEFDKIYHSDMMDYTEGMLRYEARIFGKWLKARGWPTMLKHLEPISSAGKFDTFYLWQQAFKDLFKAFEGQDMTVARMADVEVLERLKAACSTERVYRKSVVAIAGVPGDLQKMKDRGYKVVGHEHYSEEITTYHMEKRVQNIGQAVKAFEFFEQIKVQGYGAMKEKTAKATFYRHCSNLAKVGLTAAQLQQYRSGEDVRPIVIPFVRFSEVRFDAQFPAWAA